MVWMTLLPLAPAGSGSRSDGAACTRLASVRLGVAPSLLLLLLLLRASAASLSATWCDASAKAARNPGSGARCAAQSRVRDRREERRMLRRRERTAGGLASVRRPSTKQSTAAASASGSETRACMRRATPRDRCGLPSLPRPAPMAGPAAAQRQRGDAAREAQARRRPPTRGGGARQRLAAAGGARLTLRRPSAPLCRLCERRCSLCAPLGAPDAPHPLPKLSAAPGAARGPRRRSHHRRQGARLPHAAVRQQGAHKAGGTARAACSSAALACMP